MKINRIPWLLKVNLVKAQLEIQLTLHHMHDTTNNGLEPFKASQGHIFKYKH